MHALAVQTAHTVLTQATPSLGRLCLHCLSRSLANAAPHAIETVVLGVEPLWLPSRTPGQGARVIRAATSADVPAILACIRQYGGKTESNTGFILRPIQRWELETALADPARMYVLVEEEDGAFIGFTLAYDMACATFSIPKWMKRMDAPQNVKNQLQYGNTLYIRQVAKTPGSAHVGQDLETRLLKLAARDGFTRAVAEVAQDPHANAASQHLFEKLGFTNSGLTREPDGTVWRAYVKELTPSFYPD